MMSDKSRWRYGDNNTVVAAVNAETVIEIGDILYQDTDVAKPASDQANQLSLPISQTLLAGNFLGVAMDRSRAGDTDPIRVGTIGVYVFDCPGGTFELGDLIGVDWLTRPLECFANQQVVRVGRAREAIGRVARREQNSVESVYVEIRSSVMYGGIEGTPLFPVDQQEGIPVPVDHPILYCIHSHLELMNGILTVPMFRDLERESECIEFTDSEGDWEIVVRQIEGGRDGD